MAEDQLLQEQPTTPEATPVVPAAVSIGVPGPVRYPTDQATIDRERIARERAVDAGQVDGYTRRMWRKDTPWEGTVARLAAEQVLPADPNYSPYDNDEWKRLTEGLPEHYLPWMYEARSVAHGDYLRSLIEQDMEDNAHLGDLGVKGNVARFAFGLFEPSNALLAVGTMGLSRVAAAGRGIKRATALADKSQRAAGLEAATTELAEAAGKAGTGQAAGMGIAGAAVAGGVYESTRQSVNFEKDPLAVLQAMLFTAGFSAPFAYMGARQMSRIAKVAEQEAEAIGVARKVIDGQEITAHEQSILTAAEQRLHTTQELAAGLIDEPAYDFHGPMPRPASSVDGDDFAKAEAQAARKAALDKEQQLDTLAADSQIAIADAEVARADTVDAVNGPTLENPIQLAFRIAREKNESRTTAAKAAKKQAQAARALGIAKIKERLEADAAAKDAPKATSKKLARPRVEDDYDGTTPPVRGAKLQPYGSSLVESGWVHPKTGEVLMQAGGDGFFWVPADAKAFLDEHGFGNGHPNKPIAEMYLAARRGEPLDPYLAKLRDAFKTFGGEELAGAEFARVKAALSAMKQERPPVVEAPAPTPVRLTPESVAGTEVQFRMPDGEYVTGTVVGLHHNGKLKIDLYPDLPGEWKPVNKNTPRYAYRNRQDLDIDSPLYQAPEDVDGFMPGSVGSAQVAPASTAPDQGTTAMAKARIDVYATLNKSSNRVVRAMANDLIKDAIQTDDYYAQGWTASEYKKHLQRTVAHAFHAKAKDAFNEAAKIRKLGIVAKWGFHREFYENISRVNRGDRDVLIANADIAAQYTRAAGAMQDFYHTMQKHLVDEGVTGAQNLAADANYVNRMWRHDGIRDLYQKFTPDVVHQVLANAIRVAGKTGDAVFAAKFLAVIRKLEFDHVLHDVQLLSHDMTALRAELAGLVDANGAPRVSQSEIDTLVDVMFEQKQTDKDVGKPTNLKHRLLIDENYFEIVNGEKIRIADFFENDSRLLVDSYANTNAGHIAMAKKGYKSRAEFMAKVKEADELHEQTDSMTENAARYKKEKQLLLDMYSNITGRPMSMNEFSTTARLLSAGRAYTRSVFLGQLGITAASEIVNMIGMATTKAFWQQMPTFRGIIRMARTGRLTNAELGLDLDAMVAFSHDGVASYVRQNEITDHMIDRGLTRFENFANKASHAVDVISGNNHVTSATRQIGAAITVQKHVNMATGKMKLTPALRKRLVGQGMNDDVIDDVLGHLNQFTVKNADGRVDEIRWEDWQQTHPDTYDNYILTLTREVRDGIQDHDIGETMPWMHSTVGKFASELKTFLLVSHAKQSLKAMHYRDQQALNTFVLTLAAQMVTYSVQTAANFAHDEEELAKRLTLEKITASAMARMSMMGVLPALFDTAAATFTGKTLFDGTANTGNRNLAVTPSYMVASKLLGAGRTLGNAINPFADTATTQQEARDAMSILPGGNWYVIRNLNHAIGSTFPKSEPPESAYE